MSSITTASKVSKRAYRLVPLVSMLSVSAWCWSGQSVSSSNPLCDVVKELYICRSFPLGRQDRVAVVICISWTPRLVALAWMTFKVSIFILSAIMQPLWKYVAGVRYPGPTDSRLTFLEVWCSFWIICSVLNLAQKGMRSRWKNIARRWAQGTAKKSLILLPRTVEALVVAR